MRALFKTIEERRPNVSSQPISCRDDGGIRKNRSCRRSLCFAGFPFCIGFNSAFERSQAVVKGDQFVDCGGRDGEEAHEVFVLMQVGATLQALHDCQSVISIRSNQPIRICSFVHSIFLSKMGRVGLRAKGATLARALSCGFPVGLSRFSEARSCLARLTRIPASIAAVPARAGCGAAFFCARFNLPALICFSVRWISAGFLNLDWAVESWWRLMARGLFFVPLVGGPRATVSVWGWCCEG